MKFLLIVLLNIVLSSVAICQKPYPSNYVTTNITSYVSPYHRNIEINYTRIVSSQFHLEAGIGIIKQGGYWSGDIVGRENDKGVILKLEPKLVIFKNEAPIGEKHEFYVSAKIYRTYHNYTSTRYQNDDLENIIRYNVKSRVWGFVPHIGINIQIRKIHIEPSLGYGLRRLNIRNDYNGDIKELSGRYRLIHRYEPESNGKYFRGSISINLKLGFRF